MGSDADHSGLGRVRNLATEVAAAADIEGVHTVLSGAISWLRGRGIEQWPDFPREYVEHLVERGMIVVVREGNAIVASAEVHESDPDVWGEQPEAALYVHRLVVDRGHAGVGMGLVLLDGIAGIARQRGSRFLRLDTLALSERLRRYYEDAGFHEMGVTDVKTRDGRTLTLVLMEKVLKT